MADAPHIDAAQLAQMVGTLQATIEQLNATIEQLRTDLARRDAEVAELRKMVFGSKRERVVPVETEIRRRDNSPEAKERRRQEGLRKRRERRDLRSKLPSVEVEHEVADHACPTCASGHLQDIGSAEQSEEFDFVPASFVRKVHKRHKYVCSDCNTMVTAPGPKRVVDGAHYGPGLHAHVVVEKCADATPVHRLAKRFRRAGVPTSRTTLTDLFHRSAELLAPLHAELLREVAASERVNADETPVPVQAKDKTRRAYKWTFLSERAIAFVFSPSRSGEVPLSVLGGTSGTLQVDGYSGYNAVCVPESRTRVGCWAHARRRFLKARQTSLQAAEEALALIRALYEVEHEAAKLGVVGTDRHQQMRRTESAATLRRFAKWLAEHKPLHPPKSPMGDAIGFTLNNWDELKRVLDDVGLPLDNNVAERALRIVALGRKNWLFVGHDTAGENMATLMSLLSTCELHDVDPQAYLTDVLIRVGDTTQSRIGELMPWAWKPPDNNKTPPSTTG